MSDALLEQFIARQRRAQLDVHAAFLQSYRGQLLGSAAAVEPPPAAHQPEAAPANTLVWDENQVLELTCGRLANVLGPAYAAVDACKPRCGPPLPPFLFISRVTRMTAQPDRFEPCIIEWEYDFLEHGWYVANGHVPGFIAMESVHAVILLVAVMRAQLHFGESRFRALESESRLLVPQFQAGTTLRGRVEITEIIRLKEAWMIRFLYTAEVSGEKALEARITCGLFSKNRRSDRSLSSKPKTVNPVASAPAPLLQSSSPKQTFDLQDLDALQEGDLSRCFGEPRAVRPPEMLGPRGFRILSRVTAISNTGGAFGLGYIEAEQDLSGEEWVFGCHFAGDPVLPGVVQGEGCAQALAFLAFYFGLDKPFAELHIDLRSEKPGLMRFFGEVLQEPATLRFLVSVRQVEQGERVRIVADAEVRHADGRITATLEGLELAFVGRLAERRHAMTRRVEVERDESGPANLGSAEFRRALDLKYAYLAGSMAGGISSVELVAAMGRNGMLGIFGSAGLQVGQMEDAVFAIRESLGDRAFGCNLINTPRFPEGERTAARSLVHRGVPVVEASAFIQPTISLAYYKAAGLAELPDGSVASRHFLIAKVSREEAAERFLEPPPAEYLQSLREQGLISELQARLAESRPICDAITVEADSAGHTDNQSLVCVLPLVARMARQTRERYPDTPVFVGAAGGIGTPESVLAAFVMGADYVETGSINQATVEAGTSLLAKQLLAEASMSDTVMAPSSEFFELGARVQVLKRGSLYSLRAQKLYGLYKAYDSLEALPARDRELLEHEWFRRPLADIWADTRSYWAHKAPETLARAERDPKIKMALTFRWYLGQTTRWAKSGVESRRNEFQVWCGPAMGAFNRWAKGTDLEPLENRNVASIAERLMQEAWKLFRKTAGNLQPR